MKSTPLITNRFRSRTSTRGISILFFLLVTGWLSAQKYVLTHDKGGQKIQQEAKIFEAANTDVKAANLDNTFLKYEVLDLSAVQAIRNDIVASRKEFLLSTFSVKFGKREPVNFTISSADLFGEAFEFTELTQKGSRVIPFDTDIAFKGIVNGDPNQRVRLTITKDIFYAWFQLDGEEYFVEPHWYLDSKADRSSHVLYRKRDVRATPELFCGNDEVIHRAKQSKPANPSPGAEKMDPCFGADFALAGAFDMVGKYGSTGAVGVKMTGVTNNMNALYVPLAIRHEIVQIVVPASAAADPWFAGGCMDDLLPSFVAWAPGGFNPHDLGQLWVNRDVSRDDANGCTTFGLIGRAAGIGTVCTSNQYNCCEDWVSNNAAAQAHLSAHELGHDWDGTHGSSVGNTIMIPGLSSANPATTFSAANSAQIIAHRDSRTCIAACNCTLVVDCSNITDQNLNCRGDLPSVDFDLPIIVDSCGTITPSALTIIPGDSGCPGDPIIIPRTYFIQDAFGNMTQCMQTFTVESPNGPTLTCIPGGFVQCSDDIVVSVADATATFDCPSFGINPNGTVMITGPVVVGEPNCIGTTYTYTYSVTDGCGRMAECERVFTINSSSIGISCPMDMTVACASDIPPPTVADVTVTTNCDVVPAITFSGPVIVGDADCDGTTYTYTYMATSPCFPGTFVTCMRTFTLDNDGPQLTCPAETIVECSDDIVVNPTDVTVVTACGVGFNTVLSGPVVSSFPDCPNTTHTFTFEVTDDCGRTSTCERVFRIMNDPPTITCPVDMTVECEADIIVDEFLPIVVSSCDQWVDVVPSGPTLISGNPGCSGSVYEVTYLVEDACGRMAECTQTWTLDNAAPMITFCPPDMTVECSEDIMATPEKVQVVVPCDLGYEVFHTIPVPQDDLFNCSGATYVIEYYVIDECGRLDNCFQTFTVENIGPRVFPPDNQFVTCFSQIDANIDNCFYETSCNIPLINPTLVGPIYNEDKPFCHGSIVNYVYSISDICGRTSQNAQVFTFNFNNILEVKDMEVGCDDVPDPETLDGCVDADLSVNDMVFAEAGANYRLERTYTVTDPCGNVFVFVQNLFVKCDAPSNKQFCTYSDQDWGDAEAIGAILESFEGAIISPENPLVLGNPESRALYIDDISCITALLPGWGADEELPEEMNAAYANAEDCHPMPIKYNENGTINNRLASLTIALDLNCRLDESLADVNLEILCAHIPDIILTELGPTASIRDLLQLANATLAGHTDKTILKYIRQGLEGVIEYFSDCKPAPCDDLHGSYVVSPSDFTIEESRVLLNLAAYPNPVNDQLNVVLATGNEMDIDLEMYNFNGIVVRSQKVKEVIGSVELSWEVDDLASGVYFLKAINKNGDFTTIRLVKQ